MVARNPVWIQTHYIFRRDDGDASTATSYAAENTAATILLDEIFRLRATIGDNNAANQNNVRTWRLQFSLNGGTFTDVGASAAVSFANGVNLTDGDNDPNQRLSNIGGTTFNSTFQEYDENNTLTSRTWSDDYTEYEFALVMDSAQVNDGDVITFRYINNAEEVPAITNTPTVTADVPVVAVGFSKGYIFG